MWPWDHAVFGYVLYSLAVRLRGHRPGEEVVVLLVSTQAPDLVDKPLSWVFHVLPSGYAVGHSVFVALPVGVLVVVAAARRGRPTLGAAFAVGYWSHLLGDVVWASAIGRSLVFAPVLWPVRSTGGGVTLDVFTHLGRSLQRFTDLVFSPDSLLVLGVYLSLFALGCLLWLLDGHPGTATLARLRRLVAPAAE